LKADSLINQNQKGFTFVEMVALLLTVSVLGLTVLPALAKAHRKSLRARCVTNLRQIGAALEIYAQANHGYLPGPVFPAPQASYTDTSRQELAWFIAEDLGCPKPSRNTVTASNLLCPAYRPHGPEPGSPAVLRSYVLNENISKEKGVRVPPLGSLDAPHLRPLTLSALATYGPPFSISAMTDADKGTINPTLPCWNEMPYRPVHGRTRSQLFFDGHVEVRRW